MKILTPAYNRDYHTVIDATKAYFDGTDFILNDITSKWDGRLCSCHDFPGEQVKLRFSTLHKSCFATV